MSVIPNCGVTLIKRFTYRGDPEEEWSNHYWLSGVAPTSGALWETLFTDLITIEKTCYSSASKVTAAYGYDTSDTDPLEWTNSVHSIDYKALSAEIPGTLAGSVGNEMAGDQCGLIRWATTRRDSKGKLVRLRKFMHGGFITPTDYDSVDAATSAAYLLFADHLRLGNWPGNRTLQSHRGAETIQGGGASPYVTTRTLHRRGKRPKVA